MIWKFLHRCLQSHPIVAGKLEALDAVLRRVSGRMRHSDAFREFYSQKALSLLLLYVALKGESASDHGECCSQSVRNYSEGIS